MRVLIFIAFSVSGVTSGALAEERSNPEDLSFFDGRWGWDRAESTVACDKNYHTITFSEDYGSVVIRFAKPIPLADGTESRNSPYIVHEINRDSGRVTMSVVDEKRLDDAGNPVVWELVVLDKNTYTWHRHDWAAGAYTPLIVRCKDT